MSLWPFAAALALPLVVLLVADATGRRGWVTVCKPLASLTFVATGALLLPLPASAPLLLFVGLVLSLVGDVLLIPKGRSTLFLLGLASFLAAHVAYGVAFAARGVDGKAALAAAVVFVGLGIPIALWLAPHVHGNMRPAVAGYIVAITAMVTLAVACVAAGARPTLAVGAALFYASDLCVARERFVAKSSVNGLVGLPLYYVAQLLLVDGLRA